MIYERILVRYGDLTLKGKNQKEFLRLVYNLVKTKMKGLNVTIERTFNRMFIVLNGEDSNEVIKRLQYVSGLHSFSLVTKCENDINEINKKALELIKTEVKNNVTFKVEAKRADKSFSYPSQEMMKIVSAYVLKNVDNLTVDVHNPEVILHVEVRNEGTYLYLSEIKGMGGFPVGVAGKGLLMISGGIDSPVSGYLAMKQGVEIEAIHFESTPLTSIESAQKVVDLIKKLALYAPHNRIKLHMVPFMELHQALLENIPESYNITIMRRMMYRIASEVALKNDCLIIVNGESIGQVASQTLNSMSVINSVCNIPVIRPLATYDKMDIVKISRKINTFDISIKPFEDCCTVYVPKNPVTKPLMSKCEEYENKFDYASYVNACVLNTKTIEIRFDSDLDLSLLGLEVRKCI